MSSSVHDYATPRPASAVMDITEVLVTRLHEAIDLKGHFHREAVKCTRAMNASLARVQQLRDNTGETRCDRAEALAEVLDILREEVNRAAD